MMTQSLVSVVFETEQPIEIPLAMQMGTNNKLVPCDDVSKFIGIAIPGMEPDVTTLRTKASTGPLTVVHKGVAKVAVKAGTYSKGQGLTIDTSNPGKLKLADTNEPIIAYALEDVTVQDGDVITVFVR